MDLLPQSSCRPALPADEHGGDDEGDEKGPEQWVPCVFRHKTLFRRLKAGSLSSRPRGRSGGPPGTGGAARAVPEVGDAVFHPSARSANAVIVSPRDQVNLRQEVFIQDRLEPALPVTSAVGTVGPVKDAQDTFRPRAEPARDGTA
ncbi:hypothetical protein GCM10010279_27440 [Streptomyces mutabilis]|nr:hypothetical protein GCM10010279_27440 [Streptomyces mutabilis]